MATSLVPAAIYLRMSTEHQQYSLHHQKEAIERYAEQHGFAIVKIYSDAGKSGIVLKHRSGLRQLLLEVLSRPEYKAILVYDVSRWGRFQDADEAAYYEFICKSAGVPVHYTAETFQNDGSLASLIMKALKRTMAGEFSRELGVKVFAGQKRLAEMGFKQGGHPGYALRRLLLGADRKPKGRLGRGEYKGQLTDRVILIPGPRDEVRVVRRIYKRLLAGENTVAIARNLNRDGIPYAGVVKWTYSQVTAILTHPKYMGCHVYGRTSQRLRTSMIPMPPSQWVLTPGAFEPLVSLSTFLAAQHVLAARPHNRSDQELLDRLSAHLAKEGRLSLRILRQVEGLPSPEVLRSRFGSYLKACELIGYDRAREVRTNDTRLRMQQLLREWMLRVHEMFPDDVSLLRPGGQRRMRLLIRGDIQVSVLVARFKRIRLRKGPQWMVEPKPDEGMTVLLRLTPENSVVQDVHLLPDLQYGKLVWLTLKDKRLRRGVLLHDIRSLVDAVVGMHKASAEFS